MNQRYVSQFKELYIFVFLSIALCVWDGCASPQNSDTRNFPTINAYIEKRLKFLHECGFPQVEMRAEPSAEGGEILMYGAVPSQGVYDTLVAFTTFHNLNPDLPAKIDWKVTLEKHETNTTRITVRTLQKSGSVVGKLSRPLGALVKLDGNIQPLPKLHPKSDEDFEWLLVNSIDGNKLETPILINLRWFNAVKKPALKGRVSVIGYETGGFVGVPSAVSSHTGPIESSGFHFESYFVIVKKL